MEFGVAAFSAIVGVALSKLCSVKEKKLKPDAVFMKDKLGLITALMEDYARRGGRASSVQMQLIAQLRRLAYDIEDCIDCFHANKTPLGDFAKQISDLKYRAQQMSQDIISLAAIVSVMGTPVQEDVVVPNPKQSQDPPGNMNSCLVYLYLFPPNHPVKTKPLIRRWLAEGLVQREDLAVKNFLFFIDSSYINSIQRSNNGKVKRCQPTPETLGNIAQRSMSEKFILFCDGTAQLQEEEARRLSVQPSANAHLNLPQDLSRLRTLAVFASAGAANPASYEDVLNFANYKVLRVLDLKECAHLSDSHIKAIYKQVLMKYLSINLGSINRIERDIGYLDQLETLDLSGEGETVVTVFKEVLLLPKLKHLFGKFQLNTTMLGWRLRKFLRDKSVLETLAGFVTGGSPGFPQLMMRMGRVRKVKIWFKSDSSQKNLDAISLAITKFIRDGINEPNLNRSLSMDFEKCSRPFVNAIRSDADKKGRLDSLKLRGKLTQFPQFVEQLCAIQELCLWSTGLSWDQIRDGLTTLGILKYLKLVEDNLGRIKIKPSHLKSIKRMCVACVPRLDIAIQADALPHLVSLHILCQALDVTPASPSIKISHMKELEEITLLRAVKDTIRAEWQQAASRHPHKPVLLSIEGP